MRVLLLRFGELYLKGDNRRIFEDILIHNIQNALEGLKHSFSKTFGRYVISDYDDSDEDILVERLTKVFGLHSLSKAKQINASEEEITSEIAKIKCENKSFKVFVKRADKNFPISSMDLAKRMGELILRNNSGSWVDLYHPEVEVHIDIRLNKKAYIFSDSIKCQGGLPLGCSGKGLLLLSGGIDSPVSGYLISKRGLKIDALHFQSYPYTSIEAKEKVLVLAEKLKSYVGPFKLHIVSFTRVQEAIHAYCAPEYMITIMRRIMMRVAERICIENSLGAIITGESLGQVASQTMQSMTVTGGVVKNIPIFRPCIAMDKEDIIKIANDIDTFQTSILPYEDCCTVFLPKNPVIKPNIEKAEKEERFLDIEQLVSECLNTREIIEIK